MWKSALSALAAAMLVVPAAGQGITPGDSVALTVVAPDDHPAVEGCLSGIRTGLEELGFVEGQNLQITIESAGQDAERAGDAAQTAVANQTRVIVPISTEAAVAVGAETGDQPVVFCAVADPVGAGLAEDTLRPGGNVTGVSDLTPLSQHLGLINEVLPDGKTLGVVFDPANPTSQRLLARLREFAPGAGFTLVEAEIGDPAEMAEIVTELAGQVDAIYLTDDDTVGEGLDAAITAAEEEQVPLFAGEVEWVAQGAIAALGFDYEELGRQTAGIINRIFTGENPADIPITQAESTILFVNAKAASAMGLPLAPGFIARADEIIE